MCVSAILQFNLKWINSKPLGCGAVASCTLMTTEWPADMTPRGFKMWCCKQSYIIDDQPLLFQRLTQNQSVWVKNHLDWTLKIQFLPGLFWSSPIFHFSTLKRKPWVVFYNRWFSDAKVKINSLNVVPFHSESKISLLVLQFYVPRRPRAVIVKER